VESHHDLISLFERDLFGKPVPTFPDHAPGRCVAPAACAAAAAIIAVPLFRLRDVYFAIAVWIFVEIVADRVLSNGKN